MSMLDPGAKIKEALRPYSIDVDAYTDAFLERRLMIRMRHHQLTAFDDYKALLARDPEERRRLVELLSVTVTEFFRDSMFCNEVLDPLFDRILASVGARSMVAWSAGCATGQEPYSLAFLLDTFLRLRRRAPVFTIHATDISAANLRIAAEATYSNNIVQAMPARFHKYFEELADGQRRVIPGIRSLIKFGRHDLADKPPVSNLDLILCRNVMIYLRPEAKMSILKRFHEALAPHGFLILGASEIILEPNLFKPLDTKHKLYQKI